MGRVCEICEREPLENKVICSSLCGDVRQAVLDMGRKYKPTNGCDNCWGDLHQGCTETCNREFRESLEFGKELWSIVRLAVSAGAVQTRPSKEANLDKEVV